MSKQIDRREVDKKDFVVVKDKRTLDVTKVIAPHELQIGIEGYKRACLRIEGDEFITGRLTIDGGCKGALSLFDGTSAVKAGTGTTVVAGNDGSITVGVDPNYIASRQAGVSIAQGGGLSSSVNVAGSLLLSIDSSYLSSNLIAGSDISLTTNNANQTVISSTAERIKAGVGLKSSLAGRDLTLLLNLQAGDGIDLTTSNDGQITISTPTIVGGTGIQVSTGAGGQVQVSLSASPQGGTITDMVINAEPTGNLDGINTVFTLPDGGIDRSSFMLWLNGQLLTQDSDFNLAGSTITFIGSDIPRPPDVLRALYTRQVSTKMYALSVAPSQVTVTNDSAVGLTLPQSPDPTDSLMLFLNGQLLTQGDQHDYTLIGNSVTFNRAASPADVIRATYSYSN